MPQEYAEIDWIHDAGRMRKDIESLAEDLGISQSVEFIESLDSPELFFAASDVLVAPFLNEHSSSFNIVEGMVFGLPVIATNIAENKEIIKHERNGILVRQGDVSELASSMRRLGVDRGELLRFSKSAQQHSQHFSVSAAA